LYNAGSFIEGKDLEGQKFDFEAKIDSWRVENNSAKFLAPPNAVLDIEFRSGRKASEIRAYFPISPCTASHRIDWSYGEGNWLETEWVLIRYVK
ncbi:MAG TPA: hypothetical protein PKV67_09805, partial [Hyphomonas sp.]|nr:hypothetical protein [Hyphomonas sp.]